MTSAEPGKLTSTAEVTNVSTHGFWILIGDKERYLSFENFPWFRDASIGRLANVELQSPHHLYWPDLDIDIGIESIDQPETFPLLSRLTRSSNRETLPIAEAIAQKRLLRFTYAGHTRDVEPHTYGMDKESNRALVAYQIRGESHSGQGVGWKTFHESKIQALSVLEETFAAPRHGYQRNDPALPSIIAQL